MKRQFLVTTFHRNCKVLNFVGKITIFPGLKHALDYGTHLNLKVHVMVQCAWVWRSQSAASSSRPSL